MTLGIITSVITKNLHTITTTYTTNNNSYTKINKHNVNSSQNTHAAD